MINSKTSSFIKKTSLLCMLMLLTSCSADIEQYQESTPEFKLEKFFNGKVIGYGLVTDFNDNITRRFTVDIVGTWQGNKGTLDEDFIYDDGETQFRRWHIEKINSTEYQGKADDIIGTATGKRSGAVVHWQYTMALKVDGDTYEVHFDDTMALIDDNHMINKAKINKFGINIANVTLFFEKLKQP